MQLDKLTIKVLNPKNTSEIQSFEKKLAGPSAENDMEFELQSWTAPWREEALNHYLVQGWTFGVFSAGELQGYIMAQPLLFFQRMTQTLWVEHIAAIDKKTYLALIEVIYKSSREKHLQRVVFSSNDTNIEALAKYKYSQESWNQLVVLTTKIQPGT